MARSLLPSNLFTPIARRLSNSIRSLLSANSIQNAQSESTTPPQDEPERHPNIVGTVPYHTSYTFLQHTKPVTEFPPRLDADFSPLGRELMMQAVRRKGIVNFWWTPMTDNIGRMNYAERQGKEIYESISFHLSESKEHDVHKGTYSRSLNSETPHDFEPFPSSPDHQFKAYIFVCTHGARDCRCQDRGRPLVNALHMEQFRRQQEQLRMRKGGDEMLNRIVIGEVAHVGGHKYAANVLVYPFGDWLGQVTPAHAPQLLDEIWSRLHLLDTKRLIQEQRGLTDELDMRIKAPLIVDESLWRGRMSLTKEEQVKLFERYSSSPKR